MDMPEASGICDVLVGAENKSPYSLDQILLELHGCCANTNRVNGVSRSSFISIKELGAD
jgi:hypothetical protein